MSEEESFVILGSSPMSSLENDGLQSMKETGSRFTSLKNSQINDLKTAQISASQEIQPEMCVSIKKQPSIQLSEAESASLKTQKKIDKDQEIAASKLWSKEIQVQVEENTSLSLDDYALKSPLEQHEQQQVHEDGQQKPINSLGSVESDSPGSRFTSLKISDFKSAEIKPSQTENQLDRHSEMEISARKQASIQEVNKDKELAASKLWSREPQDEVNENMIALSLEDCAVKTPPQQQQQQKTPENGKQKSTETSIKKTTPEVSTGSSLAASFLMGEINSDVLKTSVYSQFPSISMEASAEDVIKLQNMVTEYSQLKSMIKKANNTMKIFYENSLQWKEKMQSMEENYKQQLDNCKKEIEELRTHNNEMDKNFQTQIEALQIARQKDRQEYIQAISEKSALLENMRAQIIKLEQQQLASFDIVCKDQDQEQIDKVHVTHLEQELKIKELKRQLSELLASNLDMKDIEKHYVDELNCLKVNLTAAEELIAKNHSEVTQLTKINKEKDAKIEALETSLKSLQTAFEEQTERILLLETQSELHRKDFELEKQSRETTAKEKQQILHDLRSLQKRNQELIEEQQKIADNYQKKILSVAASTDAQLTSAAAAAETYFNNPQRPIRVLPASETALIPAIVPTLVTYHMCPICNKGFKSLHILLSHVNDCVDKN